MRVSFNTLATLCAALVVLSANTAISHPGSDRFITNTSSRYLLGSAISYQLSEALSASQGDLPPLRRYNVPVPIAEGLLYTQKECRSSDCAPTVHATKDWFALFSCSAAKKSTTTASYDPTNIEPFSETSESASTFVCDYAGPHNASVYPS